MTVSWWCSGSAGQPWTWTYRPLIGVWLLASAVIGLRELAWRRWAPDGAVRSGRQDAAFFGAVLGLVAVSEWPLGPLGAGYLLSVGMLRYLVYTLLVAPLLIIGTPQWMWRRLLTTNSWVLRATRLVTRWPFALAIANVVLVVTHLPPVVDTLKVWQAGSFGLDMLWLLGGLIMWWPVIGKLEEIPRLGDPAREVFLFGQSIVPTVPASFLTFATLPLFGLYELAPPVWLGYDIVADQRIAGLTMKIGGGIVLWIIIATLFLRWATRQERIDRGKATEADMAAEVRSWEGRAPVSGSRS
ncbi:cytochrome c oxidase assembly protein [Euzebya sp.]|uniref:cytochrome c oxidase assembly protein n=1 Tax=Euzebya sp. TaxID=1971409 RepID=UPI0035171C59